MSMVGCKVRRPMILLWLSNDDAGGCGRYTLETRAGFAAENGIKEGTCVGWCNRCVLGRPPEPPQGFAVISGFDQQRLARGCGSASQITFVVAASPASLVCQWDHLRRYAVVVQGEGRGAVRWASSRWGHNIPGVLLSVKD